MIKAILKNVITAAALLVLFAVLSSVFATAFTFQDMGDMTFKAASYGILTGAMFTAMIGSFVLD